MKYEVIIKEVTEDDLFSIISGFLSGSSYWAKDIWADDSSFQRAQEELRLESRNYMNKLGELGVEEDIYFEEILSRVLINNDALTIELIDSYPEDEIWDSYELTLEKLKDGISKLFVNPNYNTLSIDPTDWDANESEKAVQCAIFGDIIFA